MRLDVRGTPRDAMLHVATLRNRLSPVADAQRRFVTGCGAGSSS